MSVILWLNVQKRFYIQNVILQRVISTVLKTMGYKTSAPLFIQFMEFSCKTNYTSVQKGIGVLSVVTAPCDIISY